MFIVNNKGNICEELKAITIENKPNELIVKKINDKREELITEYCDLPYSIRLNTVEYYLKKYIMNYKDKLEVMAICVNDKVFGIYEKQSAKEIFQEIVNALKRKEILFDLRNYEKGKEIE